MSWNEIKLEVGEEVKRLMEERHVSADEVKMMIHHAETEGDKLYQPDANRYLTKRVIGKATLYVDYAIEADKYVVRSVYAHKAELKG